MNRTVVVIVVALSAWLAAPLPAQASWTSPLAPGTIGAARAKTMPSGPTPSSSVSGRNVGLSWGAVTLPGGAPVDGYMVRRFDGGGDVYAVGGGCAGILTSPGCTEAAVPPGSWRYAVTPVLAGWSGAEGSQSSAVTVASPSLSLSPTTVTSLPATLSGSLSDFVTGDTVTFRLDDPSTGPVLSSAIAPDPVPSSGSSSVSSVVIPAGTSNGAHTIYAVGSSGAPTASLAVSVAADVTAPEVSSAVIVKAAGGSAGFIKQSGSYYVYANVTDPGSPASGVAMVSANVSTVTTGATAVSLVSGSYSVGGVSYGYRSAVQTANATLSAGSKAFSIAASDAAGNSVTQGGFSVTVDNTAPSGSDIQTTNGTGGTAGKAESGDTVTYTFTEPMDPESILAGWDGTATTVTAFLEQQGGSDRFQIKNAANTLVLPLGTIRLNDTGYTTADRSFSGSTMVLSGSTIVVALGTPDGAAGTVTSAATMRWTPSATATDRAGNACGTGNVNESGAADVEF